MINLVEFLLSWSSSLEEFFFLVLRRLRQHSLLSDCIGIKLFRVLLIRFFLLMFWLSIRNAVENPVARCFYELASRRQTRRQARKGATQGQVSLSCSPGPTNPGTRWNIVKAHSTKGDNHDTFHRYPPSRWPERHKCHLIQEIVPHRAGSKGLCQTCMTSRAGGPWRNPHYLWERGRSWPCGNRRAICSVEYPGIAGQRR